MPQIEVEHALKLIRCRQRDQFATVFESTRLDDLVENLGLEPGHDMRQVRRVEDAFEQPAPIAADRVGARARGGILWFWHGTGDDTVARTEETVLNGGSG